MIYENLVNRLRKAAGPAIDFPDTLYDEAADAIEELSKRVPPVPHGRLIDADVLRAKMYHEAFETDSPMQKWDGGCWIRYKMFERLEENAPTIIPADKEG